MNILRNLKEEEIFECGYFAAINELKELYDKRVAAGDSKLIAANEVMILIRDKERELDQ